MARLNRILFVLLFFLTPSIYAPLALASGLSLTAAKEGALLHGVRRVALVIEPIPYEAVRAGVSAVRLEAIARKQIEAQGLVVLSADDMRRIASFDPSEVPPLVSLYLDADRDGKTYSGFFRLSVMEIAMPVRSPGRPVAMTSWMKEGRLYPTSRARFDHEVNSITSDALGELMTIYRGANMKR